MNELLDAEEEISHQYALKSYQNFKLALFVFLFFIVGVLIQVFTRTQNDLLIMIFGIPLFLTLPLSTIGFFRAVKSFYLKEPNSNKRTIALLGNLLIAGILLSLIFANFMDVQKALQ